MKFVGGSRNGQDVPFHLETEALVCKRLSLLEHTQRSGWPHDAPAPTPTKTERWVLRWWRWADGSKTYFMAEADASDAHVNSCAPKVLAEFRPQ
jgi:hypothetical protein